MARRRKLVALKPTLFIACEGTSSEYQYFESWAQSEEALNSFEKVTVYPDEKEDRPKTTPYQLFEIAKREMNLLSADYCWIVIDKDNHPRMQETFDGAADCGIEIAFSSRSFEEWILLHFEKNNSAFNATECKNANDKPTNCGTQLVPDCSTVDCLTGHIRRQNFISDYSKKKTFDLYTRIKDQTDVAIINSAWLRYKMKASLSSVHPTLYNLNPYTDVDKLILVLNGLKEKIEWGESNINIDLNGWTVKVINLDSKITLNISHSNSLAVVLSPEFESTSFFTTDDAHRNTSCIVLHKTYLSHINGSRNNIFYSGDIVEYVLESNEQQYFLFIADNGATRIYIEL